MSNSIAMAWPRSLKLPVDSLKSGLVVLVIAVTAALAVGAVYIALAGETEALEPPDELFQVSQALDTFTKSVNANGSSDFVFRPLFIQGRRPPSPENDEAELSKPAGPVEQAQPPVYNIDGVNLLGVGKVAERGFVMLKVDGEKLLRLAIGDEYEGWVLKTVNARSAVFETTAGDRQTELSLAFGEVLPLPVALSATASSEQGAAKSLAVESGDATESPVDGAPAEAEAAPPQYNSFENMYKKRMQDQETQQQRKNL